MKAKDIEIGGLYTARISGKFTTVRVDRVDYRSRPGRFAHTGAAVRTIYEVTNMNTGRQITFRSAAKFRSKVVSSAPVVSGVIADALRRVSRIESKYSTEAGATKAERREAQSLVENVLHPVDPE